jgi:predicted nucleic acid-binding protein
LAAFLVDTNVLVYAHDPHDRWKQERALAILDRLIPQGLAVRSVQCRTEFFSVVRWKLPDPLSPEDALAQVERFALACPVLDLTSMIVLEGCRGSQVYGLSLWDALVWASAKLNQIPHVLTEVAPHGRVLEGVRFLNPFDPSFDLPLLSR